jgi:DNA polymerase-3 subunit epsilon
LKLLFIDCETTGTDPAKHAVVQIAGQVFVDGDERERFDLKMKPLPGQLVAKDALEVNGLTMDMLRDYPEPLAQLKEFRRILGRYVQKFDRLDKFILGAYNARFDYDFVRKFFENQGDKFFGSWVWFPPIDVMGMAAVELMEERSTLENFKLRTVCRQFGIEVQDERLHDGQYDIQLTKELYELLMERRNKHAVS